jgi:hypothetical protein
MNKLIVPVALLLFIILGTFCLSYFDKVDRANTEFQHAKLLTEQAQESLLARHKMLDHRNRVQSGHLANREALRLAEARFAAAEQKQLDILHRKRQIEAELDRLAITLQDAIETAKRQALGTEHLTIELRSGKKLADARLRKIDESSVSIVHSDGISSVPLAELPDKLQLELGLDGATTLTALKKLKSPKTQIDP